MKYIVIDKGQNKCVNIVVWDGISEWEPPEGSVAVASDGSIVIGDDVEEKDGVWQKIESDPK